MRQLEPEPPQQLHLLMAPEELNVALDMADMLDGQLPHWHRGRPDHVPAERADEQFERELEKAKRVSAGLPEDPDPATDEKE